jgi:L-serine dehydratase
MGLFGGLLGWEADDERLPDSARALADAGIALRIETVDVGDPHPNTYRLTLRGAGASHTLIAISTGGGMMEVVSIDGVDLRMDGGYDETLVWLDGAPRDAVARWAAGLDADEVLTHEIDGGLLLQVKAAGFVADGDLAELRPARVRRLGRVLPVPSRRGVELPFRGSAELLEHDGDRHTPLWRLAVAYEMARSGLGEDEVVAKMVDIVRILRRSIASGIAGTHYEDRVLGHQSGRFLEMMEAGRLLDGGALNRIVLYVTALMEVKSSMGVIVAAPTAGACAGLPGAVIAMAESMGRSEEEMARAMLAAGLIGVVFTTAGPSRPRSAAARRRAGPRPAWRRRRS